MKTSTVEVGELVSTLSAAGVEKQLATLPGVHQADVNYVAGSATVHYDEAQTSLQAIRQRVIDCGYHCRGELVPAHVCSPVDHKMAGDAHAGHAAHAGHEMHAAHAGHGDSSAQPMSDMMHDMGHAPGMSMEGMANDMRNRFFVTPFGLERKLFLFIVATGAIAYPGWPFFVAAWRA